MTAALGPRLGPRLRPPWITLACSAVMLALVFVEWLYFGAAPAAADAAAPPPAATQAVAPRLASFQPPPASAYDEIAERPLFIPDRRPQQDAEPAKLAPPPVPPTLLVEGVVLSPGRHYAVIQHGNPPRLDSVSEGETVDGWTVASIDRDHVSLRSGTATLDFAVGKSPRAAPAVRRPRGGE